MGRLLVIAAAVFTLLFGTGSLNVLCKCGPCPSVPGGAAAAPATCHAEQGDVDTGCCCCTESEDEPATDEPLPAKAPSRCPCLYWTSVPISTSDTLPGLALVKRAIAWAPVLLLEVAPAPLGPGAAATMRAGPHGPRDPTIRLQAWLCVWTT